MIVGGVLGVSVGLAAESMGALSAVALGLLGASVGAGFGIVAPIVVIVWVLRFA